MTESRNYRLVHGGGDTAKIPHVLIVGGGYLGMYTAKRLEKKLGAGEARITVVDPNSYMTYQPFLPEAAAGSISPRHVVVPLRKVFDRMAAESDPDHLFLEALIFGMYDLRRDGTLACGQTAVHPGRWFTLELRFSGDRIEARIDGRRLVRLRDASFTAGMAGIGCSYDPVCFDNLTIE